jgi:gluconate 2-dehydrogenase gamma chain
MSTDADDATRGLTRRSVMAAALAAAYPGWAFAQGAPAPAQSAFFYLTEREVRILTAAVDRIIPRDWWPSASEAGVVDFLDYQLATAWGQGERLFRQGPHHAGTPQQGYQLPHTPAELYRAALAAPSWDAFVTNSTADQDRTLTALEKGEMTLGDIPGAAFFTALRQNTIEGYFCDPIHNGNRGLAGWRMLGFPGANAYYLTEVDRFELDYARPPSGVAWRPGDDSAGVSGRLGR